MNLIDAHVDFQKPFLDYWEHNGQMRKDLPLLLMNTTNVQSGNHAISAAVEIKPQHFPNSIDMLHLVDSLTGKSIPLATAVLLNARFPFVNPVGSIPGSNLQFGDAGYYDNYGAENASNIIHVLRAHIKNKYPELSDRVEFVSVVIENSSVEKDSKLNVKSQYYAPLNALVKIRSANTRYALADLERAADVFYKFSLSLVAISVDEDENQKVVPGIPLARHLSNTAVKAIRKSCMNQANRDDSKFKKLLERLSPSEITTTRNP